MSSKNGLPPRDTTGKFAKKEADGKEAKKVPVSPSTLSAAEPSSPPKQLFPSSADSQQEQEIRKVKPQLSSSSSIPSFPPTSSPLSSSSSPTSSDSEKPSPKKSKSHRRHSGKAVIGKISDFHGDAGDDVQEFIREIKTARTCNDWDGKTTCRHIVAHLKGPASAFVQSSWLKESHWTKVSWLVRLQQLEEQFGHPGKLRKQSKAKQARSRIQRPGEGVASYSACLGDLADQGGVTPEDLISIFIDGLASRKVKAMLLANDPDTWEDAVSHARRLESAFDSVSEVSEVSRSRHRVAAARILREQQSDADSEDEKSAPATAVIKVSAVEQLLRALTVQLTTSEKREEEREVERKAEKAARALEAQASAAPSLAPTAAFRPRPLEEVQCYNCRAFGHYAAQCPRPSRNPPRGRPPSTSGGRGYQPQPYPQQRRSGNWQ